MKNIKNLHLGNNIPQGIKKENYKINGVEYKHNSKGYRCAEFEKTNSLKVFSIGCSYVYGTGVQENQIFHEIISSSLTTSNINWNLGMIARSNDYIRRMIYLCVPILNPDLVLINYTFPSRREYFDLDGELFAYFTNMINWAKDKQLYVSKSLFELSSKYDDCSNFISNHMAITAFLQLNNLPYLYSSIEPHPVPDEKYVGQFQQLDLSEKHPGARSHSATAKNFIYKLEKLNILNQLHETFHVI